MIPAGLEMRPGTKKFVMFGREEESTVLLDQYQQSLEGKDDKRQRIVLIGGSSGIGKTTLAQSLKHKVTSDGGFFVSGKFDITFTEPLDAFVEAFTDFTDQFLRRKCAKVEKLKKSVLDAVGSEAQLLVDMIPALQQIVGSQNDGTDATKLGVQAVHQFRFVFCSFVSAICTKDSPLVLFLDDLQWADTASLELIRFLLISCKGLPFLIVSCHRNKDDYPSRPFVSGLSELESDKERVIVTTIELSNLNATLVNALVSTVLGLGPTDTVQLAEIVYKQTHGNIFYAIQYLRFLCDQQVLQYTGAKWTWDDSKLLSLGGTAESVADLLTQKIRKELTDRVTLEAMKVSSCLGREIDDSALSLILGTSATKSLQEAEKLGLVVFLPEHGGYRFAHDGMQQAAYNLVPAEERAEFNLRLGRRLWRSSSSKAQRENIFLIVSLLSQGQSLLSDRKERVAVAKLHLIAAQKAVSISAFSDAAMYLEGGLELMPDDRWKSEYQLTLQLYSTAAEVQASIANFQRVEELIAEVLEHAQSLDDRLRSYMTLVNALGQHHSMKRAIKVAIEVLGALGVRMDRPTKLNIVRSYLKTKAKLRNKTVEDIMALPPMTDERKLACVELMLVMLNYLYIGQSPALPLFVFRIIQVCLRYGRCPGMSGAFAGYGFLLCGWFNDYEGGVRFGKLGLTLASSDGVKSCIVQTFTNYYAGVDFWQNPVKESIDDIKYGSRLAWEIGVVDFAVLMEALCAMHQYYAGVPLSVVIRCVDECINHCKVYKQENVLIGMNAMMQFLRNAAGASKAKGNLSGSIFNKNSALLETEEMNLDLVAVLVRFYSMESAYLFNDLNECQEVFSQNFQHKRSPSPMYRAQKMNMVEALIAIYLLREGLVVSSPRRTKRVARTNLRLLQKSARLCPVNFRNKATLVSAELASLARNKNREEVVGLYKESIEAASENGFINEEAIACERLSEHYQRLGDTDRAEEYMLRSCQLFHRWGAAGKTKSMKKTCKDSLETMDSDEPV